LADFINTKSRKYSFSKFLFIRESEGVYSYLKKKVVVTKQKDTLTIRVGGGFMQIDEFLEAN
jgi:hypothetical protein